MPLHPVAIELLETHRADGGVQREPVRHAAGAHRGEARDQLGDTVAVYLEDGPVATGLPSTIVDMTGERPRILRAGAVAVDELREVVADIVDATTVAADTADAGTPQAGDAEPTPTSS